MYSNFMPILKKRKPFLAEQHMVCGKTGLPDGSAFCLKGDGLYPLELEVNPFSIPASCLYHDFSVPHEHTSGRSPAKECSIACNIVFIYFKWRKQKSLKARCWVLFCVSVYWMSWLAHPYKVPLELIKLTCIETCTYFHMLLKWKEMPHSWECKFHQEEKKKCFFEWGLWGMGLLWVEKNQKDLLVYGVTSIPPQIWWRRGHKHQCHLWGFLTVENTLWLHWLSHLGLDQI